MGGSSLAKKATVFQERVLHLGIAEAIARLKQFTVLDLRIGLAGKLPPALYHPLVDCSGVETPVL